MHSMKMNSFVTVVVFYWAVLTRSRHLLMHCLLPNELHGKGSGCSWRSAALPFGGSWLPLTNWPLRNTPHTQGNDSMGGRVSPRIGGMRGWKSSEFETSSLELKQNNIWFVLLVGKNELMGWIWLDNTFKLAHSNIRSS